MPSTRATTFPPAAARGRLLQILGVGFGLAVALGNTIAAGIVRTPGEIATHLPNAWLFLGVWVAGAAYAMISAFSLAELGAMLPLEGGQYVFARRALGDYAGFIVGWSDWLSTCGTASAVAIVIGEYAGLLFPALAGRTPLVACAVVVGFAALQWRGLRWGSRTQEITAALKALAFLAVVAACFGLGGPAASVADTRTLPVGLSLVTGLVLALQAVIYTYDGWDAVIYFSEEVREPGRDIPRAMFGSVLAVMAIYLLLNAALIYVVPLPRIAGEKFALGIAAQQIFGARGNTVILAVMVLSLLSGMNAYHLMATRVLFAISRDGLFSRRAARINAGGTPVIALLASATVGVLFIASGTFEKVIAVLAFFFVANYTLSFLSLFVLRRREPNTPRPYRAWGYPWTTGFALAGSVAFLAGAIAGDTHTSLRALVLLAASYPAYRLSKWLARP